MTNKNKLKTIVGIIIPLLFFFVSCRSTKKVIETNSETVYLDSSVVIPAIVDKFKTDSIEIEKEYKSESGGTLIIQRDTVNKFVFIYRKPEQIIKLDSVIKYKTVVKIEKQFIHENSCRNKFHFFCIGFFFFAIVLVLLRLTLFRFK